MSQTIDDYRGHAAWELRLFFLHGNGGDGNKAFAAALDRMGKHPMRTPRDVQLAAELTAGDAACVACVQKARSMAWSEGEAMRDAAHAMNEMWLKRYRAMQAQQKRPLTTAWDEASFRSALDFAMQRYCLALGIDLLAPEPVTPKLTFIAAEPMTLALLKRLASGRAMPRRVPVF